MAIPKPVLDLAARQGGYVRRDQLVARGISSSAIDRRVSAGELIPAAAGVYVVIPSQNFVDLLRGAALRLPQAVVSHQSAAHMLQFPKLPELVPTVVVPSYTTHRFPGVTVRRCSDLIESDIVVVDGLAVTNVVRTFFDLGGLLRFRNWDAIGESLVIAGKMELASFENLTLRLARRGKPGSRYAHDFLVGRAGHDPRATVLERRGRDVLAQAGLPAPLHEHPIPWRPRRRFDDAYPNAGVAIEWDSRAWHEQRAAMVADRRRDREAAAHGWVVLRFTWEEVTERPHEIVETVRLVLHDRRIAG
ncbi:MAG TPA: type IV toxin-antitoxin system AbiEi family antitoxin domain-containing protein [Acidimicrobiia bacterium]|nr:hypothetical protein [Acidimicrobiia bacterium]HYJ23822.1 type IV toxin-antitoxin system AbiEi family antitoxin domain-containing protein [Acidimicrobiia bacterium]